MPKNPMVIRSSPLDYGVRGVKRLESVDPKAGPSPKDTYFSETEKKIRTSPVTGRQFKNPKIEKVPGAEPNTVSFVDHSRHDSGNETYIHYMKTRRDQTGQGHARALVEQIYAQHAKVADSGGPGQTVDWGQVMDDSAAHLHNSMKTQFPQVTTRGKLH